MQIIETSVIGTRSAVLRLRHPTARLQFLVFPMIHVASPRFFAEVTERLRRCDLVVVEGVAGRSLVVSALTLAYRVMPLNRRSGLVVDSIPYRSLGVPVVNADTSAAEFAVGWRTVPIWYRILLYLMIPFVAVAEFVAGSRRLLAPDIEVNDLPSDLDEELAADEAGERIERVMVTDRDALVLAALAAIHAERGPEQIVVGVVYGASHVPGIVRGLAAQLGYRPRTAEWIMVMEA